MCFKYLSKGSVKRLICMTKMTDCIGRRSLQSLHAVIEPLHFLDYIQGCMNDELVHITGGFAVTETGNAIAASFRSAEGVLKQGRICRRDNHEIVGHFLLARYQSMQAILCEICPKSPITNS